MTHTLTLTFNLTQLTADTQTGPTGPLALKPAVWVNVPGIRPVPTPPPLTEGGTVPVVRLSLTRRSASRPTVQVMRVTESLVFYLISFMIYRNFLLLYLVILLFSFKIKHHEVNLTLLTVDLIITLTV